jgi:hypothetical protein
MEKAVKSPVVLLWIGFLWLCCTVLQLSAQQPAPLPHELLPALDGIWYDSESKGFYNFNNSLDGDFIFENEHGHKNPGHYEKVGRDDEGNIMYRGKIKLVEDNTERDVFFKIYTDGKNGYCQYKCRRNPFYKMFQS